MVPKVIHYCWFGGNEKPKLFEKCYKSWKKYCPDYEIIEWNESNFDISSCPLYVRQAYESKKWAFVTDYVRLKVIHDNGGIYFDTDVELKKNIDFLLDYEAFFGFESKEFVATGLGFGAKKGVKILFEIMKDYEDISFINEDGSFDTTPCPLRNTQVFLKYGLIQDGSRQVIADNVLVLPITALCPLDFETGKINNTDETVAIHWYSASWHTKEEKRIHRKRIIRTKLIKIANRLIPDAVLKKLLGDDLYDIFKLKAQRSNVEN